MITFLIIMFKSWKFTQNPQKSPEQGFILKSQETLFQKILF